MVIHGIFIQYYLPWGFPGDTLEEYAYLVDLTPKISHLPAARRLNGAQIGKGSPLYQESKNLGIQNLKPWRVYQMIYPETARVEQVAEYFSGHFSSEIYEQPELVERISAVYRPWQTAHGKYTLRMEDTGGGLYTITDSRMHLTEGSKIEIVEEQEAIGLMTMAPLGAHPVHESAIDRDLGVAMEGWFVPIITAEPELLHRLDKTRDRKVTHQSLALT
ncbi:MAG TPA: hypothetical protein DCE41_16225 [Cytophagales bacterium]|nr:hypothetical protein [Cytophagales bacterium]HAP60756.1 hypothetical protein [Cytophagales bacterium]